ncbi:MAG: hypothetical protein UX17_C0007G0002 [Parcubacteria group bacterium GW2011_GWC2_45_7]|nr:MAG: hypothetical protein UX17_C0007G0002 [Parcubacteria group bacterium GW2011_GWC2_45_7]KKU73820.1 MAG: hypothetical protein UX98_C0004G0019 [Parcubacteria group bacterium GW2011_GWA2_47_26]
MSNYTLERKDGGLVGDAAESLADIFTFGLCSSPSEPYVVRDRDTGAVVGEVTASSPEEAGRKIAAGNWTRR